MKNEKKREGEREKKMQSRSITIKIKRNKYSGIGRRGATKGGIFPRVRG